MKTKAILLLRTPQGVSEKEEKGILQLQAEQLDKYCTANALEVLGTFYDFADSDVFRGNLKENTLVQEVLQRKPHILLITDVRIFEDDMTTFFALSRLLSENKTIVKAITNKVLVVSPFKF